MALFRMTARKNALLFLVFFAVMAMYVVLMVLMYDPHDMEKIIGVLDLFPESLVRAMGFSRLITDLTSYLASWLYGLVMYALPLVYSIILANRLVAKKLDDGTMAWLLAAPVSRLKYLATQALYLILAMAGLFLLTCLTGLFCSEIYLPGALAKGAFIRLNWTSFLVNLAMLAFCFFCSCLFSDSKKSLGLATGVTVLLLLFLMLGGISPKYEILRKISVYGLFDPVELVKGSGAKHLNALYAGRSLFFFSLAGLVFSRRQLYL